MVVSLVGQEAAGRVLRPKQVNAPPEDIISGVVRLPDPDAIPQVSKAALLPVVFDTDGHWQVDVPVEGTGKLSLVPLAPAAEQWLITLSEPEGPALPLSAWVELGRSASVLGPLASLAGVSARRWDLFTDRVGAWTIAIDHVPDAPAGLLLVGGTGPARLSSHSTSWKHTSDHSIGIVFRSEPDGRLVDAEATLYVAGREQRLRPADDGLHGDGAAGDGVFGLVLPPLPVGLARVSIVARGIDQNGLPFLRSAEHLLPVSDPTLRLTGAVTARLDGDDRLAFDIGSVSLGRARTVHLSAEVWTRTPVSDSDAEDLPGVPVAWMSTMATPDSAGNMTLSLHGSWLARVGASRQLLLRNLRVQDRDTHVVLALLPDTRVSVEQLPKTAVEAAPVAITSQMLMGVASTPLLGSAGPGTGHGNHDASGVAGSTGLLPALDRALMLVHGYCSPQIWPPSDFSGETLFFLDSFANRSHDAFAHLIGAFGGQVDSFGVVAHSQGGPAALHLLTYYTSGLDLAVGERRIQSLGSPYLGTPLAGLLAGIGQVFGIGCGPNTDLSESGAVLWAVGIPTWARNEVTVYTTSFAGLWCEFVTNLLLDNPEDGVTELDRAILPGMNVMPHFVGQCHTYLMLEPAQFLDSARNAAMDAAAAR
jgi:hypothetical protein